MCHEVYSYYSEIISEGKVREYLRFEGVSVQNRELQLQGPSALSMELFVLNCRNVVVESLSVSRVCSYDVSKVSGYLMTDCSFCGG